MTRRRAIAAAAAAAGLAVGGRIGADWMVARLERAHNQVHRKPPYRASDRALALHARLDVADLHADSLLWGRDLLQRSERGHADVPRLIEGGVAIEGWAVCTQVPRHANLDRNDDGSDDVLLLAIAQRWPPRTWRSQLERALHHAARAKGFADRSGGRLTVIRSADDLAAYRLRRVVDRDTTSVLLTIEGAHALDGDPANVERVADAGFRMIAPTHFFDNDFGGSAHGVAKGGLTAKGREMVERMEARSVLVDVAHASTATVDDVLAMARRPVVASHTGVLGSWSSVRNLGDAHLRAIAATGGLIGVGFWPEVTGGDDAAAIVRGIRHAVGVMGVEHVALGSDFDGAVPVPFDATGFVQLTDALLEDGFGDADIERVMGGNVLRLLAENLPGR
ncbi:MAG TPA: membrane dipeptidase [Candidatus Limnocylindrales bacterium]